MDEPAGGGIPAGSGYTIHSGQVSLDNLWVSLRSAQTSKIKRLVHLYYLNFARVGGFHMQGI